MSSAPAASVLVPCYRSAGFLARALDALHLGRRPRALDERRLVARQARGS